MKKYAGIIGLAILVALMPHLGFPSDFDTIFYTVSGLIIAGVLFSNRKTYCNNCKNALESDVSEHAEHISDSNRSE